MAERLSREQFGAGICWLATTFEMRFLSEQTWLGVGRISEIVKAMKSYSYMDQAPLQEVDIHNGIEDMLTIMQHRLKHGIVVRRDYDRALPPVPVYGSELNQVWTNLIDNAVDAVEEGGELTIRSHREGNCAVIEISDTGHGIPADVLRRLFEPFFTTKPLGKGNGRGLHIAYRSGIGTTGDSPSWRTKAGPRFRYACRSCVRMPQVDAVSAHLAAQPAIRTQVAYQTLPVSAFLEQDGEVVMRVRVARVGIQACPIAPLGFLDPAEAFERDWPVEVKDRVHRKVHERLVDDLQRVAAALLVFTQQGAEIDIGAVVRLTARATVRSRADRPVPRLARPSS